MDQDKITIYEREHGAELFPQFRELPDDETARIRRTFLLKLGLPSDFSNLELILNIRNRQTSISMWNAEDDHFDLNALFCELKIELKEKLYLNWFRMDDVDELFTRDIIRNFWDIWYPGPDDVDLFDVDQNWILSVDHSGFVSYLRL